MKQRDLTLSVLCIIFLYGVIQAQGGAVLSQKRWKRSDDVPPLEAVVNQLSQKVAADDARIAELEARMDKAQAHIAFHAEFSKDPVPLGPSAPIVLDKVVTNVGNGYDAVTGNFKVPISGTYMLVVNFMGDLHTYMYVDIMVDSDRIDTSISHGDGHTWDHVSESVVLHLAAGQRVWLQRGAEQSVTKNMRGSHWTTFSGFLINADP